MEEDSPANESSLSINRKYVVREEWVEECIAKKRLIDEREGLEDGKSSMYNIFFFFFWWKSGIEL